MLLTRNRFITHPDTPASYTALQHLRVNALADALEFIAAPVGGVDISCQVFHSVGQSVPNGVATTFTFDSEDYDTDGMHDPAVNPSRITIQTAGKYLIWAYANWDTNATGSRESRLMVNGPTIVQNTLSAVSGARTMHEILEVVELAVGDFVEEAGVQTSGGALSVLGGSALGIFLGAVKILG